MSLAATSDIEEGDQCYVFGCTGHIKERSDKLVCDKCDVEIGGEEDGQDT